jgi:hypothetical protein
MTFAYRVDRWADDGNSILDYVAAVADLAVARAAYRAACRRWPEAKITLRQGARVVERNWSTSEGRQLMRPSLIRDRAAPSQLAGGDGK